MLRLILLLVIIIYTVHSDISQFTIKLRCLKFVGVEVFIRAVGILSFIVLEPLLR